ncbi:MAG: rubrerythrin family protein [Deltaproteobacteria bacterium]|nr:rubrerythrin family protein [Deltaproteobacteria bacterium]
MGPKTNENLKAAFAGESQAHMKYLAFAGAAEKEGFRNIGRLFTAIAFAERVHATNHHEALFGSTPTVKNLETAVGGENYEVKDMYPPFKAAADQEGEKQASLSFHFALEAEKIHAVLYSRAKEAAASRKDFQVGDIHICSVCGHTIVGAAPDECPVCGASKEKFRKF